MHRRGEPYLIPPGTRKNNPFYVIRGNFYGKNDNEKSTGTTDEELAERMLARIKYEEKCHIEAREFKLFSWCADQYIEWKNPSKREREFIKVICSSIGDMPIHEVMQSDLVAVANTKYPKLKASTKNRAVMRPASAIIHYAAKPSHRWCSLWQIELFDEEPVKKRTTKIEDARKLINATEGLERLLLMWCYKHTDRITSAINVEGHTLHLKDDYYDRLTGKKKKIWQKAPLDPEVKDCLIAIYGRKMPTGKIFPYPNRWAVYRWLRPLAARLNVTFTPHAARHSMLSWIGDAGGNSIQIKTRAGHSSLKSAEPYLAENLKVTRDITAKFKLIRGTIRGKKRKVQ